MTNKMTTAKVLQGNKLGFEFYFFCVAFPALSALIFHYPIGQGFPPRLTGWFWRLLLVGAIAGTLTILGTPSADPMTPNLINVSALFPFVPALNSFITLLIATLFSPLRYGVQVFIDRRYYRQQYNANLSLSQFGASLRERVEVDPVSALLVSTTDNALRSKHFSLWLRRDR